MNRIKLPTVGFAGIFTLDAHKVDEYGNIVSTRRLAGPFKNLITDQGLNRMGANDSFIAYCQVGSGNTPPANTDTGLEAFVAGVQYNTGAGSSFTRSAQATPPYYAWDRLKYRFAAGVAEGNLSEVGVGWASSGSTLFSRALIVDSGGNPITITVLSDEVLDVTYEFRVYPPTTDVTGTITISGDDYDYTLRAGNVTTHYLIGLDGGNGWGIGGSSGFASTGTSAAMGTSIGRNRGRQGAIGPITGLPAGPDVPGAVTVNQITYVSSSLEREGELVFALDATTNIRCIQYQFGWCCYQVEFDPVIPKNNTNVFNITFQHSWARATI